jgi:hypothetical protein
MAMACDVEAVDCAEANAVDQPAGPVITPVVPDIVQNRNVKSPVTNPDGRFTTPDVTVPVAWNGVPAVNVTAGPPVDTVGPGTEAVAATVVGSTVAPVLIVGPGIDAVAATVAGWTLDPVATVAAGTDAVPATVAGLVCELVCTVGAATDAAPATVDGVTVAGVPGAPARTSMACATMLVAAEPVVP